MSIIELSLFSSADRPTGWLIDAVNHTLPFKSSDFVSLTLSTMIENHSGNSFGLSALDCFTQKSSADKPNGFLEWFSIVLDSVKDTKSLDLNDKVWFTASINHPEGLSAEENIDNSIIDNWVILPNGCVAGTAYRSDKEFNEAPPTHSKTDTHGVANYEYLPSIATNIVLSFCCLTTLGLNPKSNYDSVQAFSNITTLSGSTFRRRD